MSTIITHDEATGLPKILIYAPDCRTRILDTDIVSHIIQIDGLAEYPLIQGVRFIDCTVIAEDMSAFRNCFFTIGCKMVVKNCPISKLSNGEIGATVGTNLVPIKKPAEQG